MESLLPAPIQIHHPLLICHMIAYPVGVANIDEHLDAMFQKAGNMMVRGVKHVRALEKVRAHLHGWARHAVGVEIRVNTNQLLNVWTVEMGGNIPVAK
jgi:hypothetical protein